MKLLISLSMMLSLFANTAFAEVATTIASSNKMETTFVKITKLGGDSDSSVLNFATCQGSVSAPSECHSIGKRTLYTIAELRKQRLKLSAEEGGIALLDVAVVGGAILGGAAILTGGSIALSLSAAGTSAATLVPTEAGAVIGLGGGAIAVKEIKKLNPMVEDREAASLVDVLNGNASVKSMNDFVGQLTAALNF